MPGGFARAALERQDSSQEWNYDARKAGLVRSKSSLIVDFAE